MSIFEKRRNHVATRQLIRRSQNVWRLEIRRVFISRWISNSSSRQSVIYHRLTGSRGLFFLFWSSTAPRYSSLSPFECFNRILSFAGRVFELEVVVDHPPTPMDPAKHSLAHRLEVALPTGEAISGSSSLSRFAVSTPFTFLCRGLDFALVLTSSVLSSLWIPLMESYASRAKRKHVTSISASPRFEKGCNEPGPTKTRSRGIWFKTTWYQERTE